MRALVLPLAAVVSVLGAGLLAQAADPPPTAPAAAPANPLDEIPEAMPFAQPYGAPISLDKAEGFVQAAIAEAKKRGWSLSVAVVDSGATPVAFARMDGANIASAEIAGLKAATAVKFRRPTKTFEAGIQGKGFNYLLSLPNVLASRGGIPIVEDGKIVGAIGCSGGAGSQDEAVCTAALGPQDKK